MKTKSIKIFDFKKSILRTIQDLEKNDPHLEFKRTFGVGRISKTNQLSPRMVAKSLRSMVDEGFLISVQDGFVLTNKGRLYLGDHNENTTVH